MTQVVILVFLTVPSDDMAVQKDTRLLAGNWEVVSIEANGKKLKPEEGFRAVVFADSEKFAKQKEIKGSAVFKVVLDPAGSRKHIVATEARDGKKANKMEGIYEVEGDKLRLCLGEAGAAPKEFKTSPDDGSKNILMLLKRVQKLPKERDVGDQTKIEIARLDVRTLSIAVNFWIVRYNDPPEKLEDLLKPPDGKSIIESKDNLKDPWGEPFKYDPKGPKNNGKQPDIWSEGPPGKKQPIGNWKDEKPAEKKKDRKE